MVGKVLVGIVIVLSLLLSSCYPELSVQQYDRLKNDLIALDIEPPIDLQTKFTA